MIDGLYNIDVLSLAAGLINGQIENPDGTARKVSKLCGSWLEIDVKVKDGLVSDCALRVQACALGQASAAILKQDIVGASLGEITDARDALYTMLKQDGPAPTGRFAALGLLAGVKDYPARHTSTMLAFDAACEAVSKTVPNLNTT